MKIGVSEGRPLPLGMHDCFDGCNFALFSRHAARVELVLFEDAETATPVATQDLDPARHRTGDIWHVLVEGVRFGQAYAYRVHGRFAPDNGLRYWASEMQVDGFRFDLASILGRGPDGSLLANPPLLERIAEDPALCLLFNVGTEEVAFPLPAPPAGGAWRIAIDTAADAPGDVADPGQEGEVRGEAACVVSPRSLIVLVGYDSAR